MNTGEIRIGISGWRYPPWRGTFYPEGLPQRRELEYASRHAATIEINGSFYSLQRPEFYARWRDETPDNFVFSVKAPRFITHMLKLRNCEQAMANFLASGIANLGDKLGPILWQLPPTYRFDAAVLGPFLASLPRDTDEAAAIARRRNEKVKGRARLAYGACRPLRHALEVRHETFVDEAFVDLLRREQVALVVADTAGKWPLVEDLTSDFVYARLHGDAVLYVSGYSDAALERWAARFIAWSDHPYPPVTKNYHHEVELVAAIGKGGRDIPAATANDHVFAYALGLDMTRRDLQQAMGNEKKPWEIGKSFDHSAVVSYLHPASKTGHLAKGAIWLDVNGKRRQSSDLSNMIWTVAEQVSHLSKYYELFPGDIIYCGTPENVGPVVAGDVMHGHIDGLYDIDVKVV